MTRSPWTLFAAALACVYVFFCEYLPPFRSVYIPFDLDGYHFPLFDYAFQALHQGRLPQWDPTMYSGMSFISNVQTALFYPGTWLMFLASWGKERLSYLAVEELTLAHVALAFTLCVVWLRAKGLRDLAAFLGGAVYAFSGFLCLQLQHFGLVSAFAWMPLGLLGIDETARANSIRPMWKVVAAAALAFLGGYPPSWLVFAAIAGVYALASPGRWRTAPLTVAAFAFALAICGVQILPAWDATHFREPEARYGLGIKDPAFFISYFVPNYFDFSMKTPVQTNLGKEILYLGAPGIFGLIFAYRRGRAVIPALSVLAMGLLFLLNPFDLVLKTLLHSPLLLDVVRSYYFLAAIAIALAELAAHGLDALFEKKTAPVAPTALSISSFALAIWSVIQVMRWSNDDFAAGAGALFDPLVSLLLFGFAIWCIRGAEGRARQWAAAVLLLCALAELKVFGTSKRLNAAEGVGPHYSSVDFFAMNKDAYAVLRTAGDARILLQEFAPMSTVARHVGWHVPQGFDPFLSIQYRKLGEQMGSWDGDRGLILDPLKPEVMQLYGIRYVITAEQGSKYKGLIEHPRFKMVGANDSYYKVFEYLDAKPIYSFPGKLKMLSSDPEHRVMEVDSPDGGKLTFAEQGYPGWHVRVDDKLYPIDVWQTAFQSVQIAKGVHRVEFFYEERLLRWGAMISIASLVVFGLWLGLSSGSTDSRANPAASE